jgi:hypothetical protein
MNQINEIMYQLVAPAFDGLGFDGGFAEPVEENHYKRNDEPTQARGMDHGNLQVEEVKEAEEVKEPVGAIMPHRLKSVAQEDDPGNGRKEEIKSLCLRFRPRLPSNVRRCLDSANFRRREQSSSSNARTSPHRPYGCKPRATAPLLICNLGRPR